ncbi:stage II sporulation protein Q [Weizmannia acidilactici]|uniref:Stage II sporulation protein Q n=2 Tax=Weizmannia acidilactici TaxID=2607726 RepID=A0A5J4JC07_9BACI|nr:M23 family metallopeptidase [Weizmannia acidilactici]GER66391.1 stage II sporulation protein Q [Weizmannia acidilactici]GER69463.1 stage II sporulation protein Q [Weizmannia acidilactici]GER73000.1 stage II sporulation protein Q [Weizmannia acidilactici]
MREEEKKRPSQPKNIKNFLKKRWVYPALYLASAALLIAGIIWYQSLGSNSAKEKFSSDTSISQKNSENRAIEVNKAVENFKMPVKHPEMAKIEKKFYDPNASVKDQEAALVVYENTYQPNQGIDITMTNGKSFDVVAAMSGTVTKVQEDAVLGNVIEVEHDKGVVTEYQSVKDIAVKEGDAVKQGQLLAKAGQSELNKAAGTHLHFEIRKDDVAVNPENYFNKPVSDVQLPDATSGNSQSKQNQASEDTSAGQGSK